MIRGGLEAEAKLQWGRDQLIAESVSALLHVVNRHARFNGAAIS